MTSATFPVRIRRDYGPPVGRVEAVLDIPEHHRWRFVAWMLDGQARVETGPTQQHEPDSQPEPEKEPDMAKLSDITGGKYLRKEDVEQPLLATIKSVSQQDVGTDNAPEIKWVMHFREDVKPMVLNKVNANIIGGLYGDDTDAWLGKPIVLFNDPNIMFSGRVVGGIRVRAPKQRPAAPALAPKPTAPAGNPFSDMEDDIPY